MQDDTIQNIGFRWRGILRRIGALCGLAAIAGCAANVPVPTIDRIDARPVLTLAQDEAIERLVAATDSTPIPAPSPPGPAGLPSVGENTSYGFTVTETFSKALREHYAGEHAEAIKSLDSATTETAKDLNLAFESDFLKAQAYLQLGQLDNAEAALSRAEKVETRLFGTNANSRALLGEIRLWSSDYDSAIVLLGKVAAATRAWRLPTNYTGPPTNLPQLFNITTAQLRSYTALAAAYLLSNDYHSAKPWAMRAERGYADVFYVAHHPLYGPFIPTHADAYYGRALNLAVLAATRLVVDKDREAADSVFRSAHSFLDAIGFDAPKLTVDAIKAQALLAAGALHEASELAQTLSAAAAARGMADLVWRIETLRGEALLQAEQYAESENAFRAAAAAVDVVVGRLATDRSKLRFGIGKEKITYRLANADIARGDMGALFVDLERGRARAFVDMLASQVVAPDRQAALATAIRALDRKIQAARLKASAPLERTPVDRDQIEALMAERIRLLDALRSVDPELSDIFSVSTRRLEDIQQELGSGELLLYGLPSMRNESIRWLAITKTAATVETLPISHEKLRGHLNEFRAAHAASPTVKTGHTEEISRLLGVGGWKDRSAVYIVPTGQLYFVPWGALDIASPVAVLPTAGWLGRSSDAGARASAVIVGDPEFHGSLPQLAGARREAEQVGNQYRTAPLLGASATDDALRTAVGGGVQLLHIATHAKFDERAPLKSALYLSGRDNADALTAGMIFERPITADLVVLSACETGVGKAVAGEDFLGLPRSFYLGGARTVINSLWPVDDAGTLAFMSAFHRGAAGGDIGGAWLAARDRLKRQGYPPFVFGAFVVGGALRL